MTLIYYILHMCFKVAIAIHKVLKTSVHKLLLLCFSFSINLLPITRLRFIKDGLVRRCSNLDQCGIAVGVVKYLVLSMLLTLFVFSEVFASSKILEGSIEHRRDHPISGQTSLVDRGKNLLLEPAVDSKRISLVAYQNCFKSGGIETDIDDRNFTCPSLVGISCSCRYDQAPQTGNSIRICDYQNFERYQPGNEFFIGVTFSLANLTPSPMLKVKINNDLYQKKHVFDKGWHHLYTGIICYALGTKTKIKWAKTLGGIILVDDLIQHTFRIQSPLHMLNDDLWRHSWYQHSAKFMDKIMGKK